MTAPTAVHNAAPARLRRHPAVAAVLTFAIAAPLLLAPAAPAFAAAPASAAVAFRGEDKAADALFKAVKDGDPEAIKTLLGAGNLDLNSSRDKDGKTALMLAAASGRTDLVNQLLEAGADPNVRDEEGRTALHMVLAGAEPKKKKGFGRILDDAKKVGEKALRSVGGGSALAYLLPGGSALMMFAGGLMNKGGAAALLQPGAAFRVGDTGAWSGVLGAALTGGKDGGKIGGALDLLVGGGGGSLAGAAASLAGGDAASKAGAWTSLFSSAGKGNAELLRAVGNVAEMPGITDVQKTAWAGFVAAASSGDTGKVGDLLANPELQPLLAQATGGLRGAANNLPGFDGGAAITRALLSRGADINAADKTGLTALKRAQDKKLAAVAELLEPQAGGGAKATAGEQ